MLRKLLLAALVGIFGTPALAQSICPTIVEGAVLTAGQWGQCFSSKQDGLGYTPVNRAGDTMSGRLVTMASGLPRAGFSIIPGVAPTNPVDGDLWTTVAGLFARINGTTVGPFSAVGSTVPGVVQGDLLFGSAAVTLSTLPKNTSATRYLSNTGTTNNPAWAQVDLGTGVTGALPLANLPTGTLDTVLGYFTSTTAAATALPNCTTAITYNTGSHTFGCNGSTGSGTVTSVGFLNTYGLNVSGSPVTGSSSISAGVALLPLSVSLGSDTLLSNTALYFDGPSLGQGVTGTWYVTGKVSLTDTSAASQFFCKLWDGTTVIDGAATSSSGAGFGITLGMSGFLAAPAASIKISCRDTLSTSGKILFNSSGNSKDSTISGVRIQ